MTPQPGPWPCTRDDFQHGPYILEVTDEIKPGLWLLVVTNAAKNPGKGVRRTILAALNDDQSYYHLREVGEVRFPTTGREAFKWTVTVKSRTASSQWLEANYAHVRTETEAHAIKLMVELGKELVWLPPS